MPHQDCSGLDKLLELKQMAINALIQLKVDDEELIKRLVNRGNTSGRADDNEEVGRNRIQVYKNETAPVADYYAETGKAVVLNGVGTIEDIFNSIVEEIDSRKE